MESSSDNAGKLVPGLARDFPILLVDPDTTALLQLASLLEQHSYNVTPTELVSIAMSMIQRVENRFSLVMASTNMSEHEKVEFLDFLNSKNIPIVLLYPENSWESELAIIIKGVFKLKKPITFRDVKYIWQLGSTAKAPIRENVDPTELGRGISAMQIQYSANNSYPLSANNPKGKQVIDAAEDYPLSANNAKGKQVIYAAEDYPLSANNAKGKQVIDYPLSANNAKGKQVIDAAEDYPLSANNANAKGKQVIDATEDYPLSANNAKRKQVMDVEDYSLSANNAKAKGKQVMDVEDYDHGFGATGSSSNGAMLWAEKGMVDAMANAKRANEDGKNGKEKKMKPSCEGRSKGIVIQERTEPAESEEEEEVDDVFSDDEDITIEKKTRIVWTKELHGKFVEAFNSLGERKARPKTIMEEMNLPNVSQRQIASHLQKYKRQLKKLKESIEANSPPEEPSIFAPITGYSPYMFGSSSSVVPHQLYPDMTYGAGPSILNPNLPQPTMPISTAVNGLLYGQNDNQMLQFQNMYRNLYPTQGFTYLVDPRSQNQNQQFMRMYQNLNQTQGFAYPVNPQNLNQLFNQMAQMNLNQYPGSAASGGMVNQVQQFHRPQMNRAATGGLMMQNQQFQMPWMNHYPGSGVTGGLMNQQQQLRMAQMNMNPYPGSAVTTGQMNQNQQFQMPQMYNYPGSAAAGGVMNQNQQFQMNQYPGSAVTTNQSQQFQMPQMNHYAGSAITTGLMNQNQQFQMYQYPGSAATSSQRNQNEAFQMPQMNQYPRSAASGSRMNQNEGFQMPQMNQYPGSAAPSSLMNQYQEVQMPQMNHYLSSAATSGSMNQNQEVQMPQMNHYPGSSSAATGGQMNENQDFMAPAETMQGMDFLPPHSTPASETNTGYSIADILNDFPEVNVSAPTTQASPDILPYILEVQDSATTPTTEEYDGDQTMFDLTELLEPAEDETNEPPPVDPAKQFYKSLRSFLEVDDED